MPINKTIFLRNKKFMTYIKRKSQRMKNKEKMSKKKKISSLIGSIAREVSNKYLLK